MQDPGNKYREIRQIYKQVQKNNTTLHSRWDARSTKPVKKSRKKKHNNRQIYRDARFTRQMQMLWWKTYRKINEKQTNKKTKKYENLSGCKSHKTNTWKHVTTIVMGELRHKHWNRTALLRCYNCDSNTDKHEKSVRTQYLQNKCRNTTNPLRCKIYKTNTEKHAKDLLGCKIYEINVETRQNYCNARLTKQIQRDVTQLESNKDLPIKRKAWQTHC